MNATWNLTKALLMWPEISLDDKYVAQCSQGYWKFNNYKNSMVLMLPMEIVFVSAVSVDL